MLFPSLLAAIAIGNVYSKIINDDINWESITDEVNKADTTWIAARNFLPEFNQKAFKRLLGAKFDQPYTGPVKTLDDFKERANIPEEFDSRTKWPYCKSIAHIRDQSYCGSCWAFATTSALTDRFCIATKGQYKPILSSEDLLSCCNECGYGCEGGYMWKAWNYFLTTGVVTGGDYDSHEGCKPYSLMSCEHHINGSRPACPYYGELVTPSCHQRCTKVDRYNSFKKDHHKVKSMYRLNSIEAIQREIMENGPVEAGFVTYEDFATYKSGIYHHVTGERHGGHAVKIIGWGTENGVPYWLIANSWNEHWGENGYFRMLRGSNECEIESRVMAGMPKVEKRHVLPQQKVHRTD
ncbi:hypothetical protein LSTR_LSTR004990 [Laodelphax striatellus]|uniref:Peptidase C1A papain C-terminal domain-containing protein n=1 Tax=Laodelphax striatellus TaxID=195883 RepID=A0A482XI24_LAOST|nr:hypothetical protein LSTR_LSTR004990 [Laodelphax striatellus]